MDAEQLAVAAAGGLAVFCDAGALGVAAGAGAAMVATAAGVADFALAAGVATAFLGEGDGEGCVTALDGEDGEGEVPAEGVPLPALGTVGGGELTDSVTDACFLGRAVFEEAGEHPAVNRTRPVIRTATPCLRPPMRRPGMPLLAAAIPPINNPATPNSTSSPATLSPLG
jgi:hypothetical protein